MATKEEVRCTIKVESTIKVRSMDAVHGRGSVTKAEKPPASRTVGWRCNGSE